MKILRDSSPMLPYYVAINKVSHQRPVRPLEATSGMQELYEIARHLDVDVKMSF